MRLIKIEHFRCGDFENNCYILAPDEKTDEEINKGINRAISEYIQEIKQEPKIPKKLDFKDFQDETVAEARKIIEEL